MSKLEILKNCQNQKDLARILGYSEKKFTQILFSKNIISNYKAFEIPKKTSGKRKIHAPVEDLKELQAKLSAYLQECYEEIELNRISKQKQISIKSFSSFAFRQKLQAESLNQVYRFDIYNHASKHINKRYVLNIDLENFFESITFSRIVGYLQKNNDFQLRFPIAVLIAQICTIRFSKTDEGFLPQGSPTSPIISNLIGNILDIKILRLAQKYKLNYSRYADDITLSTNMKDFPQEIAYLKNSKWIVGEKLESIIIKSKFKINHKKTRLYLKSNRQEVTSLTVNQKVNINKNYYRYTRAMVNSYCRDGEYFKSKLHMDAEKVSENALNGIINFVFSIKQNNYDFSSDDKFRSFNTLTSIEKLYVEFLFHYYFVYPNKMLVIGEGYTDPLHLKLATKNTDPEVLNYIKFSALEHTKRFSKFLKIKGGTGLLCKFLKEYPVIFKAKKLSLKPFVIIVDGDKAGNDVIQIAKNLYPNHKIVGLESIFPEGQINRFIHVQHNLYIIQQPKDKAIENLYTEDITNTKIDGRELFLSNNKNEFKKDKHYDKKEFYNNVIFKNSENIDFTGFKQVIDILVYLQLYHFFYWITKEVLE